MCIVMCACLYVFIHAHVFSLENTGSDLILFLLRVVHVLTVQTDSFSLHESRIRLQMDSHSISAEKSPEVTTP